MELTAISRRSLYYCYVGMNVLLMAVSVFSFAWADIKAANNYILFYRFGFFECLVFMSALVFSCVGATERNTLADVCFVPRERSFLAKYFAYYLAESVVVLYPIIFILCGISGYEYSLSYTAQALFVHVTRLLVMIFLAHTIGFIAGYITKHYMAVTVAIPAVCIFTVINVYVFDLFGCDFSFSDALPTLFSTNMVYGNNPIYIFSSPWYDLVRLTRDLTFVFGSFALCFILSMLLSKKKLVFGAVAALCITACFCSVTTYFNVFPEKYVYEEQAVLFPVSPLASEDHILTASGTVELGVVSKLCIDVTANDENKDGIISFALDSSFKINTLTLDGKEAVYDRNNDRVNVYGYDGGILHMEYAGRPFYSGFNGLVSIYASVKSAVLPVGFAFLPLTGNESETAYDLTVTARNTVVSSLDCVETSSTATGKRCFKVSGCSRFASLFCGYFDSFERDGVTVYHAAYDKTSDFKGHGFDWVFSDLGSRRDYSDIEGDGISPFTDIEKSQCKKLFLIGYGFDSSGFPCVFDGCVFKNFGDD